MARLVYSVLASADGYVADEGGAFDWAAPSEEVHAFVNAQEESVGTYLYGRRMFEVMAVWQEMPGSESGANAMNNYADIWRAADKVVYSTTLESVTTPRTRLERSFDPHRVHTMASALERNVSIGGPTLAGAALRAGIVDDIHVFVMPVAVGGGTAWAPRGAQLELQLVGTDRFGDGAVHLHYRPRH
jgi:dihydrofolate reductase